MASAELGLKNDYADTDLISAAWLNDVADFLEMIVAGYNGYDAAGSGSTTIDPADYEETVIPMSGVLTGARTLVFPLQDGRRWLIWNNTSGAYSLTIQGSGGTGITVSQGYLRWVWTDGVNFYGGPEWSGSTDKVTRADKAYVLAGTGSQLVQAGGSLEVNATAVGNVGSGEDDLMTFSVPASVLGANGDYLEISAFGTFAANANNKRIRAKFGATTLLDTTALAINDDAFHLRVQIIRTGATSQIAIATISTGDALLVSQTAYSTPAETLSGAITFKLTGEATSDNDISQKALTVRWYPAA